MHETWMPIIGFETVYSVSSHGNVMRTGKGKAARCGRVLKPASRNGYLYVNLWRNNVQHNFDVHRLVASAFLGLPSSNMVVNHKNGVKTCNHIENLEWTTQRENIMHGLYELGKINNNPRGSKRHGSKLNEEQVIEILRLRKQGYGSRKLSEMFSVCRQSIVQIFTGRTWSHVSLTKQATNN